MISEAKTKVPEQPAADKQDNLPENNGNNKKIKLNKRKKSFASGINFCNLRTV